MFRVHLKAPFNTSIWAGTGSAKDILSAKEDEKARTRRENIGTRLAAVTGNEPSWSMRSYAYTVEMTWAQADEVSTWEYVRRVEEI